MNNDGIKEVVFEIDRKLYLTDHQELHAEQELEIEYTGHVPCPKCGMTHWMHGPCIGRPWDWIEANPRKALRMVGVSFREQDESKDLRVHVVDEDPRYPKMCVNGELNFGVSINAETGMPEGGRECICAARADDFCICDLLPND